MEVSPGKGRYLLRRRLTASSSSEEMLTTRRNNIEKVTKTHLRGSWSEATAGADGGGSGTWSVTLKETLSAGKAPRSASTIGKRPAAFRKL
ncbi:hypothetical protein LIER_06628 [Lithospermum erythrorhizon]|uniref:Uncharacterized protein n=1 Tax=Lithospermum erythrorhizon TaxID=34254 RepID=A0AAV3P9I9_LITER